MSSVILAQFINTILSSVIIGFDCYESLKVYVTLSKWNVKINRKSHNTLCYYERTYIIICYNELKVLSILILTVIC